MVLVYSAILTYLSTLAELYLDKRTADVVDEDGRTGEENDLIHRDQLPLRMVICFLIAVMFFNQWCQWHQYVALQLYVVFLYWLFLDLNVNLIWLKLRKGLFYLGKTAKTDFFLSKKLNWIIKITGAVTYGLLYLAAAKIPCLSVLWWVILKFSLLVAYLLA